MRCAPGELSLKIGQYWYYLDLLRDVGSEFVTFYAGTRIDRNRLVS